MKREKVNYTKVAEMLMFSYPEFVKMLKSGELRFRKGKDLKDVASAMNKSRKNGMNKVEYELSMLELYLKDVFLSTHTRHNTEHDTDEQESQQQDNDDKIDSEDNNKQE